MPGYLGSVSPWLATIWLIRDTGFLAITLVICLAAWRQGSLSRAAAAGAFVLAAGLYLSGGLPPVILLLLFFYTGNRVSRFRKLEKEPLERDLHAKSGPRDLAQVAANGGPALIMAGLYAVTRQPACLAALASALAASNADTWASELGMLSKRQPVSLLTGRPVQRGLSGGVTALGFLAALAGSAVIALVDGLLRLSSVPVGTVLGQFLLVLLTGLLGSVIDSLLGETLQAQYVRPSTGQLTEQTREKNQANQLVRGLAWMNNDLVNFISSLTAASLHLCLAGRLPVA